MVHLMKALRSAAASDQMGLERIFLLVGYVGMMIGENEKSLQM